MNPVKKGPGRPKKDPNADSFAPKLHQKKPKMEHKIVEDVRSDEDADDEDYSDELFDPTSRTSTKNSTRRKVKEEAYDGERETTKGRHDNSLSVLTKKFIELIRNSPDLTIDLNDSVKQLGVQKRRIYDITNVLEGIGLVEKALRNKIKWVGSQKIEDFSMGEDLSSLIEEIERLRLEEEEIDNWTNDLQQELAELSKSETNDKFSYVRFEDIKTMKNASTGDDQPFVVIRAPKGSTLEVPVSKGGQSEEYPYKMNLTSQDEEILIYVVSNDKAA